MEFDFTFIHEKIQMSKKQSQYRHLEPLYPLSPSKNDLSPRLLLKNTPLLDFSSNDYLGLRFHPEIKKRAKEYLETFGAASSSSRLIGANFGFIDPIEKKIAKLKEKEASLIFSSGYIANLTIIPTLIGKGGYILADKAIHRSLIEGAKLSKATFKRYFHNDLNHLESLLKKIRIQEKKAPIIIVTESIFSMDGDQTDLDSLILLSEQYNAPIYLDEAHATGIMGNKGMGLSNGKNIPYVMGTFSKAAGAYGAYIATSALVKEYLVNFCPGFIYTTSLPPSVYGAIDASLDLIPKMQDKRFHLMELSSYMKKRLIASNWKVSPSSSPIISILLKDEKKALTIASELIKKGIYAKAIRPPTVPKNSSRIRFSLSALHTKEEIDQLTSALNAIDIT